MLIIMPMNARAAPCCAGSSALPAMILGDEAMQFSASYGYGKVVADAPATGQAIFRDDFSPDEGHQTITLNFAKILDRDRLQAGISVPLVINSVQTQKRNESTAGFSDLSLNLGYEVLPELEYSIWKPRIFSFFQTVLPTGKSVYESSKTMGTDVRGLGLWQTHLGIAVIKRWSSWDLSFATKVGRVYGHSSSDYTVGGFWMSKGSLGSGFSFAERLRLGLSLDPTYQTSILVKSQGIESRSSNKVFFDTILTFTILAGQNESIILSYTDQTLMGPATNASLSRSGALSWTHRTER